MSRRSRRWQGPHGPEDDAAADDSRPRFPRVRRGIYLLPALVTLGNFASGFAAILFAIEGKFITASHLIILAMVCDTMDGAMARLTRTESEFGKELDSLADVVSFGVAPAVIMYQRFGLSPHPYWIFPLCYAVAGALRLARYNALDSGALDRWFRGTPIPAPAGVIVGLILALEKTQMVMSPRLVNTLLLALAYLMLSGVRYPSLRAIHNPGQPYSFRTLVVVFFIIFMFFFRFLETWLSLAILYYLSGPIIGLRAWFKAPKHGEAPAPHPPPAPHPRVS